MLSRMRMTRVARVAVLVAVAVVLVACSFTKIAYNQADTAAAWMADDYLDLTGNQKTDFQERFARFHAWHRSEQLPNTRSSCGRRGPGPGWPSPGEVLWFVDGIRTRYRTMAGKGCLTPPRC